MLVTGISQKADGTGAVETDTTLPAGAVLYTRLGPTALTRVLGGLLLLTSFAQLSGWSSRWQPHGPLVAVFGLVSGFFGGVAGNQGGLRAAALTAFGLMPKTALKARER